MEIKSAIVIGTASGLTACLVIRPLWSWCAARMRAEWWRASNATNETIYIASHALAGAAQGITFWLSWGLAAIVAVPWWQRGLSVGLANALLLIGPTALTTASVIRVPRMFYLVLMAEALVTSLCIGLACSWIWAHWP